MSFRTRLTSFFVLIVVVPMLAIGFLVFRLISDSEQGKADARANGLATAAASLYITESAAARADARTIARDASVLAEPMPRARLSALATQSGLARVTLSRGARVLADVGDRNAIAPGIAKLNRPTDELTDLANHGRFQDLLSSEIEQVRRYRHPVGLIMLDIDDFKTINDTDGHQEGDVVLKHVARVLRESSRDADTPARYGGEEMALILPHTELEGSHAIAERVRTAIEGLRVPRLDQKGVLRVTASLGAAASSEGQKDALIADADKALYVAKRRGKNRTVRAKAQTANVVAAE